MNNDIVTRLRRHSHTEYPMGDGQVFRLKMPVLSEAADEIERLRADKAELLEAIRLTAEYYLPPALDNWEWWSAYSKHATPADAERMKSYCDRANEAVRGE